MESEVTVTHFINPHLFWFKRIGADDLEHVHVLSILEQDLEQLYKNKPSCDNQFRPQIGDKVAVNFIARNKFIRAEILQKAEFQQEEYIVWAIDYGFPLLTKKEYLRHLPTNLRQDIGHIHIGGIANIYPAEQEYDDDEGNLILVKKDKWLQRTCNMLEKLITDATAVSFVLRFKSNSNHEWGDLIVVNHKGNKINALDFLLKTTTAVKAEDEIIFQTKCCKLNTIKIAPWLSNDRNTKMKFNTIKHNYEEHSQHVVATIIDEQAKRKVEDWQKRNEMGENGEFAEIPEQSCLEIDNVKVEDVTFDDSVSVVQERNYIGKAGAITKNKQQIYSTNKDLSPSELLKAFQMDDVPSERNVNNFPQLSESSLSIPSNISNRMQKLAALRNSSARAAEKKKVVTASEISLPISHSLISNENSSIASSSIRYQKLMEIRRKTANIKKQNKNIEENNHETEKCSPNGYSADVQNFQQSLNEKRNLCTTESTIKTADSFSYHLLEQSSTLSTPNPSTIKHSQKNKADVPEKIIETIQREFDTSVTSSKNSETESSVEKVKPQKEKFEVKETNILFNNEDFGLKPKASSNVDDNKIEIKDISLSECSSAGQKKTINKILKTDQAGYDSFTLVPAGYDITRLNTYKNEKNHWHRKKTTRFDSVTHDSTTSSDEFQFSRIKNDQSFSSSDFDQTPPRSKLSPNTTNHFHQNSPLKNENPENSPKCSKEYESTETMADHMNIGNSLFPSKIFA